MNGNIETESDLVEHARVIEGEYADEVRRKSYGHETPRLLLEWRKRWEPQAQLARRLVGEIHEGWHALPSVTGPVDGRLTFLYLRPQPGNRQRGGLFVVPYLATEEELRRIIRRHRPGNFGETASPWVEELT